MRPATRPEQPYTNQEIVDRVYQHFFVEKNPRSVNLGFCLYARSGCAVGCMLTSEDAEKFDGCGHIALIAEHKNKLFSEYFNNKSLPLLTKLQKMHDRGDIDIDSFRKICQDFNLTVKETVNG